MHGDASVARTYAARRRCLHRRWTTSPSVESSSPTGGLCESSILGRNSADATDVADYVDYSRLDRCVQTTGRHAVLEHHANLTRRTCPRLSVPLPPKRAAPIAAALSDVDAADRALDRLIAKKQAIKQGMMQQLLTGANTPAGFTTPWRVCSWASSCSFENGLRKASQYFGSAHAIVNFMDVIHGPIMPVRIVDAGTS